MTANLFDDEACKFVEKLKEYVLWKGHRADPRYECPSCRSEVKEVPKRSQVLTQIYSLLSGADGTVDNDGASRAALSEDWLRFFPKVPYNQNLFRAGPYDLHLRLRQQP